MSIASQPKSAAIVQLSKATIRDRAAAFVARWDGPHKEQAEKQTFWNELLAVFGVDRKEVGVYEALASRVSTDGIGWIDLLIPGEMAVEHKSTGSDLKKAMGQLVDYMASLHQSKMPWLLVNCDFEHFTWRNLETGEEGAFSLAEFPHHLDLFFWVAHYAHPHEQYEDEEAANLVATGYMAKVHDALLASNYDAHALKELMTRILFCLFADDTDVWDRGLFRNYLHLNTKEDGSDLGSTLNYIFQILNTASEKRSTRLDEDLASFAYINGDLFANTLPIPTCDEATRNALLDACRFDWSEISPAIFGSMFQNVMSPAERRELGAHYTTEQNILRTIEPLFLDDLRNELNAATSRPALERFHDKLSELTFLDPACGCGNFLVIAYREIRALETETLRRLALTGRRHQRQTVGQRAMGLHLLCKVTVDQFYGIEIDEWATRIARTALYLIDHIANREVSAEFGEHFVRFPIPAAPHIVLANALRLDWNSVLPADESAYVFGNPPFVGMSLMSKEQDEDNKMVFETPGFEMARSGRLDYVLCWYAVSIGYAGGRPIRFAYVSTNSIVQGEQARSLGPFLTKHGMEIDFAHRTFVWTSEAKGKAHVHVVIVGFSDHGQARRKVIFDYPDLKGNSLISTATNINVYLADAPNVALGKHPSPFISVPVPIEGNRPEDGGGLIVSEEEAQEIQKTDEVAAKYLRPLIGAREMLQGSRRYCLWLVSASPHELASSSVLKARLAIVKSARLAAVDNTNNQARKAKLRKLAAVPSLFTAIRQPSRNWLCIPAHSSENRRIIPMAMYGPQDISHNSTLQLEDPPLWLCGMYQSAMFTTWVKTVAGRLKSDIRLEADLAFNAFPFPDKIESKVPVIEQAMTAVLTVRADHPESPLGDLYGELSMPADLAAAHNALDKVVDGLYAPRKRFTTEADRQAVLFGRYAELSGTEVQSLPGFDE